MAWGCGRDKLVLRHFLNACHGALSVEDFEMLNDFMPFPYYTLVRFGDLSMLVLACDTLGRYARRALQVCWYSHSFLGEFDL